MKTILITLTLLSSILITNNSTAGWYDSKAAKCKIEFPGEFKTTESDMGGARGITLSGNFNNMIFLLTISIYTDEVLMIKGDGAATEKGMITNFAKGLSAKVKEKKMMPFTVGAQQGYYALVKGKSQGKKLQGYHYAVSLKDRVFQFSILSSKKDYNPIIAKKFYNSFSIK